MIWDRDVETASRDTLRRLQLERLRATVERAYHRVPLFRRRMEDRGLAPDDLRHLEDLARLPFMTKQDLRDHYPFGLFAEPLQRVVRIHASSGTRGKPTVVGYTRHDLEVWAECVAGCFCMAGGEPGHVLHNAYGYGLFTGGLGLHAGAERVGATVVPASGGHTARQILLIQDLRPDGIACTPSYLLNLADAMDEHGIDPRSTSLRYGILGAEPWSESMRQQLEARLGIDAVDIYGLSEVIGPGVANECREAKDGLHINEDHFLPEVVDPQTGEPLPPGQYGELVFTSLTKEAFPVIRYRTGDIAALYPEPCRCGRTLVRMSRIKGRVDDMLVVRGVNVFPSEVEYQLLKIPELAPHYQLVVDRGRALDRIEVWVEPAPAVTGAWGGFDPGAEVARRLEARVADVLGGALGLQVDVRLVAPGSIPRSEGKAVRVVDRRQVSP
ncbi:phenylacetate--CoA ligase [Thermaerobacter composti]|uniref:Phenylacetate-coenzyme A ligase n=1 Tax=Thermaerobacter composti TaxID=554949 RepID=A0ABZ0QN65_9FIRM|nr:phenylacetate--CoA ligase [Thermaerobacter composti]WPD18227.1 phenylacetate--CoA ligase [Thermaerobacter composti]